MIARRYTYPRIPLFQRDVPLIRGIARDGGSYDIRTREDAAGAAIALIRTADGSTHRNRPEAEGGRTNHLEHDVAWRVGRECSASRLVSTPYSIARDDVP